MVGIVRWTHATEFVVVYKGLRNFECHSFVVGDEQLCLRKFAYALFVSDL